MGKKTVIVDNVAVVTEILKGYEDIRRDLSLSFRDEAAITKKVTEYVETHKWLINEKIPFEVTLEQAFFSWYENVYQPVIAAIYHTGALEALSKRAAHEVFDLVSTAYFFLQKEGKALATPVDAARQVIVAEAENFWHRLMARLFH